MQIWQQLTLECTKLHNPTDSSSLFKLPILGVAFTGRTRSRGHSKNLKWRSISLSEFSFFEPLHSLIIAYQVPVLLICQLALSRV